jgi:ABC-2 type transport system permease protein
MVLLLEIIKHQIKQLVRDKKTIIAIIAVPIILTMLFNTNEKKQKSELYIIDEAHTRYSEDLLRILSYDDSIKIIDSTRDQVNSMMKKQKSIMALVILEDFGEAFINNKGLALELIRNYDSPENMLAEHKITNKVSIYQDMLSDSKYAMDTFKEIGVEDSNKDIIHSTLNEIINIWEEPSKHIYDSKLVSKNGKKIHWSIYTSIGFLIFFLWSVVVEGIGSFIDEKENKTYKRLLSMPVSYSKLIIGKIMAIFIYGGIQIILLLLVGRFVFSIDWFENSLALGIVIFTYLFSITCIGMLFVPFIKNQRQLGTITAIFVVISSMVGGSFFPLEIAPNIVQNIAKITPQRWAIMGIVDVISNNGIVTSHYINISILLIMGIISLCIALVLINKQNRVERGI